MYLGRMTCKIRLANKYTLRGVNGIEIKKSVHQIVQTAKVTMALSGVLRNNDLLEKIKLTDKIKEGDAISLAFGYNGENREEFTGYIKRINPKQPLELECEDEMYLLRKIRLKKAFNKKDVREVLQFIVEAVKAEFGVVIKLYEGIPAVQVNNFLINGANGIAVLQELSDKYLLSSFLIKVNGELTLYCGLAYGYKSGRVKHVLNRNTISIDDLKYQMGDDRMFKIEIINNRPDGTVKKYVFGDKKGELTKETLPGVVSEAQAKHYADAILEGLKTASYKGTFETFIFPYAEPGTVSDIIDLQFPARGGAYYIGTVGTSFTVSGGRRKPEIDIRL